MFHFVENYRRHGTVVNSHDLIKTIAVIIMIIDHAGMFFFPQDLWWRAIGRIGFPVWFFMAGFAKPSRMDRELKILAILMILADFCTVQVLFPFNALVSIMACRWMVGQIHKADVKPWAFPAILIVLAALHFPAMFMFEYGGLALMFAYCGYLCRQYPTSISKYFAIGICVIFFLVWQNMGFHFSHEQNLIMSIGTIAVAWYLVNFTSKPMPEIPEKGIGTILRFTGRNTLYIYFLHFVGFLLIATAMHPPEAFRIRFFQ